jgi:hypothetical protein
MNRIQELVNQAKKSVPYGLGPEKWIEIYNEKFAELIVRECIQVGGPEDSYTDEWFKAKVDSVQKIKEHFGVDK